MKILYPLTEKAEAKIADINRAKFAAESELASLEAQRVADAEKMAAEAARAYQAGEILPMPDNGVQGKIDGLRYVVAGLKADLAQAARAKSEARVEDLRAHAVKLQEATNTLVPRATSLRSELKTVVAELESLATSQKLFHSVWARLNIPHEPSGHIPGELLRMEL